MGGGIMKFICKECGYVYEGQTPPNPCPVCKFNNTLVDEDMDILQQLRCSQQLTEAMLDLRDKDVIEYELKMSQFRTQYEQQKQIQKQATQQSNTTTTCPRCGNTTFTPMKKKWSMLTGFATNQVELVCNNCGYKMKAK